MSVASGSSPPPPWRPTAAAAGMPPMPARPVPHNDLPARASSPGGEGEAPPLPMATALSVTVQTVAGTELACVDADPQWRLRDLVSMLDLPNHGPFVDVLFLHGATELSLADMSTLEQLEFVRLDVLSIKLCHKPLIITSSDDKTAKVWDFETGECLQTFSGHKSGVKTAAVHVDLQTGSVLVLTASGDKCAKLWNFTTGDCIFTLKGHRNPVRSAAFSHTGKRLATASSDGTVMLWDTVTGECVDTLDGMHTHYIRCVTFARCGHRLLTASNDGTALVWNLLAASNAGTSNHNRTRLGVQHLCGHSDWVNHAIFSHDDTQALTASNDRTAKLWDIKTRTCVTTFTGHTGDVTSAVFSNDSTLVLTSSTDSSARLWSLAGDFVYSIGHSCDLLYRRMDPVTKAVFSHDDAHVITCSMGTVFVWILESGAMRMSFGIGMVDKNGSPVSCGHCNTIRSVALVGDLMT